MIGKSMNRLLPLLILLSQFFGGIHLCESKYLLPDGSTCLTCPLLTDHFDADSPKDIVKEGHGDCHDCCRYVACKNDHEQKRDVVAPVGFSIDFVITEGPKIVLVKTHTFTLPPTYRPSAPIHGPPLQLVARGPPLTFTV